MARTPQPLFVCQECGTAHRKWQGQCEGCGAWNSLAEEAPLVSGPGPATASGAGRGRPVALSSLDSAEPPPPRAASNLAELDRVLGGGMVPASALLVGGDPGIGKSTLLLQAAAAYAGAGLDCLYISGEEAAAQVRLRAARLGLEKAPVRLAAETSLRDIIATLEAERPDLAIIDSIQTMWLDSVAGAPGSVAQLRAAAHELVSFAKRRGVSVVLVGHVTKEGQIAGPRVIEHMVDCVLYFEGERGHQFRLLRAVKNRFGPAGEIGVFEMTGRGLAEVPDPSALFLSERGHPAPGSVVFAGIEGTRPMLTEIQALVAPSALAMPRRTVVGLDSGRLSTILAVLEARCGVAFAGLDVFLNVAGGMRINEPAADLAVAAALISAREDVALPPETVVFGEISLSGALRPVSQHENRLKEAGKLGFTAAMLPGGGRRAREALPVPGMRLQEMADLAGFVEAILGARGAG